MFEKIKNANKIKTLYAAHTTVNEYGSTGELLGYSYSKKKAENLAKGKGWWGGDGTVIEHNAIDTGTGIFLLLRAQPVNKVDIK